MCFSISDFFHYEDAVMGCCWGGWGAGAGAAAGPAGDFGCADAGGGGTKAGGAELRGAAGAGIEVSWVRGASG